MAVSQAAYGVEKIIGNTDDATIITDVTNYEQQGYGDPSGEKMKALTWQGKNTVKLGMVFDARLIYI